MLPPGKNSCRGAPRCLSCLGMNKGSRQAAVKIDLLKDVIDGEIHDEVRWQLEASMNLVVY